MEQSKLLAHCGSVKITREELKVIPTPPGSLTHQPIPHHEIVGALIETLSFRPRRPTTPSSAGPRSVNPKHNSISPRRFGLKHFNTARG
jgi:hypothetical protein